MALNADLLAGGYLEQSRDPLSSYIHTRLEEEFPFLKEDSEAKVILRALIYDLATQRRNPDDFVYWLAKHFAQKSMVDDAYLPIFDAENPESKKLANTIKLVLDDLYQSLRGLEESERQAFFADLVATGYYGFLAQLFINFVSFDLVMLKSIAYFYPEVDYKQAYPLVLNQEQADYLRAALQSYIQNEGVIGFNEQGLEIDTELLYSYFAQHPTEIFVK
ncbi:hypothetical protein [Psittacicella gerlachiana]|uniref:Uncharacterized protein n=1 Tax=Psittacicella gerlachiana TaxID=2028574 RepID=A0A3A1YAR9_9GAMM|nr:hypothetical protein [Psittacicella gerlachiana]RIY34278.1 hypothetical protein CKF59_05710 [Psittacicella gerlachiana]